MDTTKWKSVLLPRDIYEELVVIARVEGRTLSGQLRYIHNQWKRDNLSEKDMAYIDQRVEEYKTSANNVPLTSKSFSV
jgi:macrodomain Ter protein organizer (MatP/YcbG family)